MKKPAVIVLIFLLFSVFAYGQTEEPSNPDVLIIPVDEDIGRSLTVFIRRSLEQAEALNVETVIIEMNTFGGLVESALQIATLIGSAEPQTVAYIPARAESTGVSWSAGALISFAADSIFMAPGTSMGAAAPVITGAEGSVAAGEKTVSAVRGQMAALAEKNGYPKSVALAMVDLDIELVEVSIDGKIELVDAADLEIIQEDAEEQGKSFKKGRTVSKEGKLLTLTALEMERYGISSGTPENRRDLFGMLGLDDPSVLEAETSVPDDIVALITGSSITAILIMLGLGALYLEITSPGFGIPGTAAIIIFAVLFSSNAMLGYVGSLEILLFLAGVVLLVVELFLIPGFGAAGISGFVLITISLLLSQQNFVIPEFSWQFDILRRNFLNIGAGILGSIVLIALLFNIFPRTGLFGRLILQSSQQKDDGFGMQTDGSSNSLVGKSGQAVTTLRPSGKADIDGNIFIVETDGEFLDAGAEIIVTRVNSNRILVKGA